MRELTELFKRSAKGDEKAFSLIVSETEASVYRYLFSLVGNREDALDLSQETYLKLWRTLASFRGDCTPTTWILRIAKNCALDHLRRAARGSPLPLVTQDKAGDEQPIELPDPSVDADPEKAFARKETQKAVRDAVLSLNEEQQTILILREFEGLSYDEIASRLKLEVGTVKSRLSRARNAVKEFLISRNFF